MSKKICEIFGPLLGISGHHILLKFQPSIMYIGLAVVKQVIFRRSQLSRNSVIGANFGSRHEIVLDGALRPQNAKFLPYESYMFLNQFTDIGYIYLKKL